MISMTLECLAEKIGAELIGDNCQFIGCSTDTRSIKQNELFVALKGPSFDGHEYVNLAENANAAAVVVERSVETKIPLLKVSDTKKALADIARVWRENFNIPIIAVTGSNGKTTVKEMLHSILECNGSVLSTKGNLNNEIGVPQTLFNLSEEHDYAVVEMGANHANEIANLCTMAKPSVAVITQCAPSHLEGFGSIEGVAKAKGEMFEYLAKTGGQKVAVINADDDYSSLWNELAGDCKKICFGLDTESVDVTANENNKSSAFSEVTLTLGGQKVDVKLPLPGKHNVMNALAATACCAALNIPLNVIRKGLEKMASVPGRLQLKTGLKNLKIIDDTYNANPRSYAAALDVLCQSKGQQWIALGDMGELGESAEALHAEAGEKARLAGVKRLFTIGKLSEKAAESFGRGAQHFTDQEQLIKIIKNELDKDITLLIKGSRFTHMERVVQALESDNAFTAS